MVLWSIGSVGSLDSLRTFYALREYSNPPPWTRPEVEGATTPLPIANFIGIPTQGPAPLFVQFQDQSQYNPTSWVWDFTSDGIVDSTDQNPWFIYPAPGIYNVTLTVSNSAGSNSITKFQYVVSIDVTPEYYITPGYIDPGYFEVH